MIFLLSKIPVKTIITNPPQSSSSILTTDTRLACGVRSDASVSPVWRWFFYLEAQPGVYVKEGEIDGTSRRKRIQPDGTLILTDLESGDSGIYECVVTSAGGNDSRNATLNVIGKLFR